MPGDMATRFFEKINEDKKLQEKFQVIKKRDSRKKFFEVIKLAGDSGFIFNNSELITVVKKVNRSFLVKK